MQYTHAGHILSLELFCLLVLPLVLGCTVSPFNDSTLTVDDEEQRDEDRVAELLVAELLLDARLSTLPLLLSPVELCLCKGDPQWDEKVSLLSRVA